MTPVLALFAQGSSHRLMVELFSARFGGELSLEQELEDLAQYLPFWLRPIWKGIIGFLKPYIRRAKIASTMASVDRQAKTIGDNWAATERQAQVSKAVVQAKTEFPNARVSVKKMPEHPCDAVLIEHPPDPKNAAQMQLGFGALEIRAPYRTD